VLTVEEERALLTQGSGVLVHVFDDMLARVLERRRVPDFLQSPKT
jgi:hypothetical protein